MKKTMPSQTKKRILVVDDTTKNIQLVGSILTDKYDLTFALNGKDGLEKARSEAFDLILLGYSPFFSVVADRLRLGREADRVPHRAGGPPTGSRTGWIQMEKDEPGRPPGE